MDVGKQEKQKIHVLLLNKAVVRNYVFVIFFYLYFFKYFSSTYISS